MSVEKNKENARRALGIFTDPALVPKVFAPEYVYHNPEGDLRGPAAFQDYLKTNFGAFTDVDVREIHVLGEGDLVATFLSFDGVMSKELMGMPTTGKRFTMEACMLTRHREDGMQVEAWPFMDTAEFYKQLGLAAPVG